MRRIERCLGQCRTGLLLVLVGALVTDGRLPRPGNHRDLVRCRVLGVPPGGRDRFGGHLLTGRVRLFDAPDVGQDGRRRIGAGVLRRGRRRVSRLPAPEWPGLARIGPGAHLRLGHQLLDDEDLGTCGGLAPLAGGRAIHESGDDVLEIRVHLANDLVEERVVRESLCHLEPAVRQLGQVVGPLLEHVSGGRDLGRQLGVAGRDGPGEVLEQVGSRVELLDLLDDRDRLADDRITQQPCTDDLVLRGIDDGPRQPEGTVQDRLVGRRRGARLGELPLMVHGATALDADHRVDGGHHVGDIAHVRRDRSTGRVVEHAAQLLRVVAVQGREVPVMDHVRVAGAFDDLHLGARGERARLEATAHETRQLLEALPVGGTDHEQRPRQRRDDVRRVTALGHDAVDAVRWQQLLPQQADGGLGDDHRVSGVPSAVGEPGCVSLVAPVGHIELRDGDDVRRGHVRGPGMDHRGQVHVAEMARLDEPELATAALFGGCAHHRHPKPQLVGDRCERQAGPHTGGSDDVVPARMPDLRERVVFHADRHVERPRPEAPDECRGHVRHAALDLEACRLEPLVHPVGCVVLLEPHLGIGVDPVAQADERRVRFLEQLTNTLLRVGPVHLGTRPLVHVAGKRDA